MTTISMPENVKRIIETLQQHGFEAYAVGGCVRDSFLGREPEDWDITTSAMPQETKALFPRTFDTGIQHGTITVLLGGEGYEVTTYRIDGEYEDNRHPKEVQFTRSLREDLLRRDFTINAMAYNDSQGLVDIFGGLDDLEKKVIRCVGNAMDRLSEDALRILRGVRFSAQLGFSIEEETKKAIMALAGNLQNISAERIRVELIKLLISDRPEYIKVAYELGITKVVLPEFDAMMETKQETPHHMYNVGEHTLHAMANVPADKVLRFTMLLHDIGKPEMKTIDAMGVAHFKKHDVRSEHMTKAVMNRLKFDNDTARKVTKLVGFHDYRMPAKMKNVRRAMSKMGKELFPLYMQVRRADVLAQSEYLRKEKIQNLDEIEACYQEIIKEHQAVCIADLAVTGKDLMAAGVPQGPQIGEKLKCLLDYVLENPKENEKEKLLERLKHI